MPPYVFNTQMCKEQVIWLHGYQNTQIQGPHFGPALHSLGDSLDKMKLKDRFRQDFSFLSYFRTQVARNKRHLPFMVRRKSSSWSHFEATVQRLGRLSDKLRLLRPI